MGIFVEGVELEGDGNDNTIHADFAAVDALFRQQSRYRSDDYYAWSREVLGHGGDDVILRDRPGDVVANAQVQGYVNYDAIHLNGNVVIDGGSGKDTVSYMAYPGAIDIDLQPVAQQTAHEPYFWGDAADVSGLAKLKGLSGIDVHGHDYLASIENAIGTHFDDLIRGSDGNNVLEGLSGKDVLNGRGGNDFLLAGNHNDVAWGGDGHDVIDGGNGNDTLNGEDGNDTMTGGDGVDVMNGGDGDDIMAGGLGDDTLRGGNDDDTIYGGGGKDTAFGDDGDDVIYIQGSGGRAYGGEGDDHVFGGDGNDHLGAGHFFTGDDTLEGGAGNDILVAGQGDTVLGGSGIDKIILKFDGKGGVFASTDDSGNGIFGVLDGKTLASTGVLSSIESITTGTGDDEILFHDASRNRVSSGGGDDLVETAGGNDLVSTGRGKDTVEAGDGADYVRSQADNDLVEAGDGDDTVYGGHGDDSLRGGDDDDRILGGAGDDAVTGGHGADTLTGGAGADGFVWRAGDHGLDSVTDFVIGTDYIGIQDYLQFPVPIGGSYVGKVFALETHDGSATVLTAKSDNGWKSFARLEGLQVEEVWAAIQNGDLFDGGTVFDGPGGFEL